MFDGRKPWKFILKYSWMIGSMRLVKLRSMNFLETLQFLLDTILQTIFSGINQRG